MKTFIASAAIVAVATSTITTPVQAATYKVVKGKLVNAKTGKVVTKTTVFKKKLYQKGTLAKGTVLYKKQLYVNGVIAKGFKLYKGTLYEKGKVHKGIKTFKEQLYVDGKPHPLEYVFVYQNVLHNGEQLYMGMKEFNGKLYKDGYVYTGVADNNAYYVDGSKVFEGRIDQAQITVQYTSDTSAIVRIGKFPTTIKFDSPLTKVATQGASSSYQFHEGKNHLGEFEFTFTGIQSSSSFSVTIDTLYYGVGRGALNFNNKTFSFRPLLQLKSNSDFNALYNDLEKLKNMNKDNAKWFTTEHDALNARALKYEQLFGNNGTAAINNESVYYAAHYLYNEFAQLKSTYDKQYFQ